MKSYNWWYNWGWLICTVFATLCITIYVQYKELVRLRPLQNKTYCKQLSFQQTLSYSAKYEMFVDSLQYCKKSQRIRLTDSLIKYKTLLTNENR